VVEASDVLKQFQAGRRATFQWVLLLAAGCVAEFGLVVAVFVRTVWGQQTDDSSLAGSVLGRARIISELQHILNLVSVSALVLTAVLVTALGALRRRPDLAVVSVGVLATTNFATRYLKHDLLHRPDLGVDGSTSYVGNTLPSGHTTVAMSVSIALLIVVPPATQWLVAVLGAIGSAGMGVATLSAGWHRPSDAIAAYFVVGACTSALVLVLLLLDRRRAGPVRRHAQVTTTSICLAVLGVLGLLAGAISWATANSDAVDPGRQHLFAAYAGGVAAIAGTAFLVMAALLLVADRIAAQPQKNVPVVVAPPRTEFADYRTGPV
jgi:membrane-associated phospholipid phosphatase